MTMKYERVRLEKYLFSRTGVIIGVYPQTADPRTPYAYFRPPSGISLSGLTGGVIDLLTGDLVFPFAEVMHDRSLLTWATRVADEARITREPGEVCFKCGDRSYHYHTSENNNYEDT